MGKFADKYFEEDPWRIIENGFNPSYGLVAESVFSLANEHMGLRGYFDEGYSGESLQGSYINGIYERRFVGAGYKGIPDTTEFMINTVDWAYTGIQCNGQKLDLHVSKFSEFRRELDMRTGQLTRSFVWHVDGATDVKFTFTRILSMRYMEFAETCVAWEILKGTAELEICAGLDFSRLHMTTGENYWNCEELAENDYCAVMGVTETTGQRVFAAVLFDVSGAAQPIEPQKPSVVFKSNKSGKLTRRVFVEKQGESSFSAASVSAKEKLHDFTLDLLEDNRKWWAQQWALSDIEIDGSAEDQQGIRYCVFQMHQAVHSGKQRVVIGAKGLTGEAYSGNTFWEAETYFLPFYLFTNPEAANGILRFRYETLGEAKKRAKELDCEGAFYPIATISGAECCTLWQHANTQLQVSTAVAYGIAHHVRVTGDDTFLREKGAEMLVEVCRMLATRGGFDQITGEYGYYGVMGPDEFQLMVNHNAYTNFMAMKTFFFTLEVLESLQETDPERYAALNVTDAERADWRKKASKMKIIFDEDTLLFEQHEGFFHLPHVDIASIPVEDFPLYHHWSYDRIYRNDMIKQPDVLLFMFLYGSDFTNAELVANFDYYEPRCTHESSLSPSIHSILAAQIGRTDLAYKLFRFGARLDLDNYNRNTNEGLHTPNIAGSWMNIVYGFGGLRSDGEWLSFCPALPEGWSRLRFKLMYHGEVLCVEMTKDGVRLNTESGAKVKVRLYDKAVTLDKEGVFAPYECLGN